MLPVAAAAAAAAGSGGVGGGDASTARAAGSVTGAGVAAAAPSVGLPEQLRRLHIVHDLHARCAARIRKELSARELRMQPLDMWTVLKELEPGRAFPPKKCKALFESQRECKPIVAPAAAVSVHTLFVVCLFICKARTHFYARARRRRQQLLRQRRRRGTVTAQRDGHPRHGRITVEVRKGGIIRLHTSTELPDFMIPKTSSA